MSRYQYVLMDMDQTIFDFDRSEREAFAIAMKGYGLPCDDEIIRLYHDINRELWDLFEVGGVKREELKLIRFERLWERLGIKGVPPEEMNDTYMNTLAKTCFLMPGAEELCKALYGRCRLFLATNGSIIAQTGRFSRSPLTGYIEEVFISEEMGYRKPQREFFEAIFERLGITDRREVIMFGDSLSSDIAGGVAAGIDTCWLSDAPPSPMPTYQISTLEEFLPIILGIPTTK